MTALKKLNLARVLNDYDFGGYLITNGVAPFIDGRTELMRTQSAATKLSDRRLAEGLCRRHRDHPCP